MGDSQSIGMIWIAMRGRGRLSRDGGHSLRGVGREGSSFSRVLGGTVGRCVFQLFLGALEVRRRNEERYVGIRN